MESSVRSAGTAIEGNKDPEKNRLDSSFIALPLVSPSSAIFPAARIFDLFLELLRLIALMSSSLAPYGVGAIMKSGSNAGASLPVAQLVETDGQSQSEDGKCLVEN